jgi:hypothetical protein
VSLPDIAFFPGAEYAVRNNPTFPDVKGGHALIYGLSELRRWDGRELWCLDLSGPELVQQMTPWWNVSLAIDHPAHLAPHLNWDWGTSGYRGVEIFGPNYRWICIDDRNFSWWVMRAFTPQALADAVAGRGVLSVHAGSDFHEGAFYQIYTFVHLPAGLFRMACRKLDYTPALG